MLFGIVFLPIALRGGADFRQLYTGGLMVRTGESHQLYDFEKGLAVQRTVAPTPSQLLVSHPAYEELLFVPLSMAGYRSAYYIFLCVNVVFLLLTLKLLSPSATNLTKRWEVLPACLAAAFFPIWRTMLQGQDSIMLLTLLASALVLLDRSQPLQAGLLAGLGLFKFQIVIPLALLFLLWRQWRFIAGWFISAGTAILVSVWMVGKHGVLQYLAMITGMSVHLSSAADEIRFTTSPMDMLNVRGLLTAFLHNHISHMWLQATIILGSVAILFIASRAQVSLELSIITATLASYHLIGHDASVMLIPILLGLSSGSRMRMAAAVAVMVGAVASVLPSYGYLGSLPILCMFAIEVRREV
jgi:hypothetical protein